ncbi:hypothetical protein ABMA27_002188 [Loxostege sticticalis]|uniref:Uncharacterized protein n=1 Tax=Loxostege sticticalis TaxID=481309 RepID=A0ABR3HWX5_LOXSC
MTNYVKIAIVMCACVALSTAQFGYPGFDNFFGTAYAAPSYGGLSAAARDPRANTGPVVFPPSPPSDGSQSSGVVVGASGYGFVPAQGPSAPRYFYQGFFLR